MHTLLLTGANGFVGNYLTHRLLVEGYNVIATGQGPERLSVHHPHYQYISLNITDPALVHQVFQRFQPEIVVHAGAMTKPDDCELNKEAAWEVNVMGTENLLNEAKHLSCFFVHISTDFIFKGTAEKYTEADEGNPVNYYGLTKWEAEKRVTAYEGPWAILRPILMYGQPQAGRQNILTFVADSLKDNKPIRLFTDQRRLPTYVEDFVWGITKVIENKATGVFHFCGKDVLTPFEIGVKVAEYLKLDTSLVKPVTAEEFQQPAKRPPQTMFDLTKVRQMFGYEPTSFNEGLRKTFEPINK